MLPLRIRHTVLVLVLCLHGAMSACTSTCPTGTSAAGTPPPGGAAQWCEGNARPSEKVPAFAATPPVDDLNDPAGVPPDPSGRPLLGPMTTWTADGQLASHGSYQLASDKSSRPEGIWTFWHHNGRVRSRGNYADGIRVGCFSLWDEDGNYRSTRWSTASQSFQDVACKGPTTKSLDELEDRLNEARSDTVVFDINIGTLFSRGGFGIKNHSYVVAEPSLSHSVEFSLRRHLPRFRLGGLVAIRRSDDGGHDSWIAAATLALPLPSPHHRLDLDASIGLGLQKTDAELALREDPTYRSDLPLTFLGPYAAVEIDAAIRLHQKLELVIAGRAEGGLPGRWETTKVFRNQIDTPIRHSENWQVGRPSLGLGLGMRVSFY